MMIFCDADDVVDADADGVEDDVEDGDADDGVGLVVFLSWHPLLLIECSSCD